MKKILPFIFTALLFGCGSESNTSTDGNIDENDPLPYDESTSEEDISKTSDADYQSQEDLPEFDIIDAQYIVVANTLRGRDKPSTSGTPTNSYPMGTLLKGLDVTKERELLNLGSVSGACDDYGYFWYQVEDFDNNKAWGYGQFLFEIKWEPDATPYSINGTTYYLGSAVAMSYGPSDSDGLTGCDDLELMFFYNKNSKTAYPIHTNNKLNNEGANHFVSGFDSNLLLRMSGEGGGSDLEKIKQLDNGDIKLSFNNGYQEGSNESELLIGFENDKFVIKNHSDTSRDY